MKTILVIGNFGYIDRLNGQTMRTRTIYNSILKRYSDYCLIESVNTTENRFACCTKAVIKMLGADRIVILPAQSAVRPLLFLVSLLGASERTIQIAIGGWLSEIIKTPFWIKRENSLKAVLVQMQSQRKSLEEIGLSNVVYFPNYREDTGEIVEIKEKKTPPKRFVFYARVIREKGIFEAIDAISLLSCDGVDCSLDIYGPVEDSIKTEFTSKIDNIVNINYHRPLKPGEILTTLNFYDAMLFPTYYEGEGFPGTILEAFMAGVPVIASDWKYNKEIVENEVTGLICQPNSVDSIVGCIKQLISNYDMYKSMPVKCKEIASTFSAKNVTKILFDALELD